jgi:hypothetical protein
MVITPKGVRQGETDLGCYGLKIRGIDDAVRYLGAVAPDDPELTVSIEHDPRPGSVFRLSDTGVEVPLSDGVSRAVMTRSGHVRVELGRRYDHEALLHPLLSGCCAIFNWWNGRDALHAGAVVLNGAAWGILGARGQGKSTTLGYLSLHGASVLCDDVLVEVDGDALAGPGFVDLRPDAGAHLRAGRDLGVLGGRARHRLDLPPPPRRVPLAGWLSLKWGERAQLVPVPIERRLPLLLENRAVLLAPASPQKFLKYSVMPFYELERPRDWGVLPHVAELLDTLR